MKRLTRIAASALLTIAGATTALLAVAGAAAAAPADVPDPRPTLNVSTGTINVGTG